MDTAVFFPLSKFKELPATLPPEGTLSIELKEGIPVIRASSCVQEQIEGLLIKQKENGLTHQEMKEFDRYEEIDDFLSFLNRMIRNLYISDNT